MLLKSNRCFWSPSARTGDPLAASVSSGPNIATGAPGDSTPGASCGWVCLGLSLCFVSFFLGREAQPKDALPAHGCSQVQMMSRLRGPSPFGLAPELVQAQNRLMSRVCGAFTVVLGRGFSCASPGAALGVLVDSPIGHLAAAHSSE